MFSMCSELTPRAHVPDNRIPQLMQPCSFPTLMSSMRCKSKKPRKVRQKKKKNKIGGGSCPPGKCTVFGGGKCPNLGQANVRILGVVNVRLANDLPPLYSQQHLSHEIGKISQTASKTCALNYV